MLQVTMVMVGKTREGFIQDGLAFYQKRLRPHLNLTLKNVREEKEGANLTQEKIRSREGERLRGQVPPRAWVVALDPQGKEMTSEDFAAWLATQELESRVLTFLIGGHLGLDGAVLTAAHEHLALSRLTLTHEMARMVLLEQLYRAITIKSGHPYHV
jgi:23S rRNA (pseudouridine1915-N3)-methyltransferase